MPLSVKGVPYKIPEYSLTGDLLAYLNCGLQYRYQNRGALPPSKPVQLWFGEFIHGVMEEAYLMWRDNPLYKKFPWNWKKHIRPIELRINSRLLARGLNPPPHIFCPFDSSMKKKGWCPDNNHPHKLIASKRIEMAINTWGHHLFPLISEAEIKLKGLRMMPNYKPGKSRSNYYGIGGVADVISSVKLAEAPSGNLILHYLQKEKNVQKIIEENNLDEYEIIIDYKGMRRPSLDDPSWEHHKWQILTYAWLRSQQANTRKVIAGILFYFNELVLTKTDIKELKKEVSSNKTDVLPKGNDKKVIDNEYPDKLSIPFREERSIRIIPIDEENIQKALEKFDETVEEIENSVVAEMHGKPIFDSWKAQPLERNCTVCDFKIICKEANTNTKNSGGPYYPTVP
jgi:CRISPR/Cas system-associated exonuclease Cas4 (RecB family)